MNPPGYEFTKTLKLYYFREKQMVSLSVMVSPTYVLTYYINSDIFDKILELSVHPDGAHIKPFFILRKREYLRFSHDSSGGMQTNLRIDNGKWETLVKDYRYKKESSQLPIETCVVD